MNFNYSYRAFLITSLLFGILFLTLWSIKLSSEKPPELEILPIEYLEILPPEEPEEALAQTTNSKIKTNRAYNEAEKFIRESEIEWLENEDDPSATLRVQDDEIEYDLSESSQNALEAAQKRLEANKMKLSENENSENKNKSTKGANTKTTISYSLKDRKAINLPNPVYTCEGGGKVVINIKVDQLGKILKTDYNKNASTTTNGCLIESALEYAKIATFNTKAGMDDQIGTISYNFPGQN